MNFNFFSVCMCSVCVVGYSISQIDAAQILSVLLLRLPVKFPIKGEGLKWISGCGLQYPRGYFHMAASLKEPRQFFGICNHLISSRCLHASAVTFKNVTATERKRKKVPLRWSDVQDTPALKSKARERRSSARHTLKKSSDGAGKVVEATVVSDREALKRRRRMPEPVVWSDSAAETMLLYKDSKRIQ